ncbi:MAG: 3-isopropylmalate dehydratase small subunit, partial [Acetanaerobacterium sp.]
FLVTDNESDLGKHAFADVNPEFSSAVSAGDILVAGRNFGCGSSREHAPLAIRGAGISCIVAESFARTFFRNCINRGFLAIEFPEARACIRQGDQLSIDVESGKITNITTAKEYAFEPVPAFMLDICQRGGLVQFIQGQLNLRASQ